MFHGRCEGAFAGASVRVCHMLQRRVRAVEHLRDHNNPCGHECTPYHTPGWLPACRILPGGTLGEWLRQCVHRVPCGARVARVRRALSTCHQNSGANTCAVVRKCRHYELGRRHGRLRRPEPVAFLQEGGDLRLTCPHCGHVAEAEIRSEVRTCPQCGHVFELIICETRATVDRLLLRS